MTVTSPSFPRGLPPMRTEAEARSMIDTIHAGAATWRAGQSSIGAAREDERKRMADFFAALEAFKTIAHHAQKGTEIPAIDRGIGELLSGLDDALHDAGVTQAAWSTAIDEMV